MQTDQKVNVLLVDDHPENLLALEAILDSLGQNLVRANSGQEALRSLLQLDFAVILLDVQMPGMDGFETATLIRERERSRHTPIIFLTAFSTSDTLMFKGYALGAVDYLIKPFVPEILKSKVGVFVDLFKKTAQVKQQAAELTKVNSVLRESEQRFRSLSACSPVGIFLTDIEGRCTYTNPRCQAICGLTFEDSLGYGWSQTVHQEDRDWVLAEWSVWTSKEREYANEFRFQPQKGIIRWVHLSSSPMISDKGELMGHVGTVEDITERKQAEEEIYTLNAELEHRVIERTAQLEGANRQKDELLQSEQIARVKAQAAEERFRDLVNGLEHAIFWEAEPTTEHFTFVSQSAEHILGYPIEKWTSESDFWVNLLHPDDREWAEAWVQKETQEGRNAEFEYRCIAADGGVVWLRNRAYVVRDSQGSVLKLRGLMIDITEAKQAESALKERAEELAGLTTVLKKTNKALEKRNLELDQFAYVISHDLKAPLRAIANLSQWLEEDLADKLTDDTRHQMNLLRGRVYRMENLIDGLLQYSRVGRMNTELETFDVETLLKEVIDSLAPPPEFTVEIKPEMPTLTTPRLRLEQVFANLIGNAVKHHNRREGHVKISVQEQHDFYEFAVADDGPGIAPQYHDKVFVIFQTLQSRDRAENTGIGLSLVKKIVESKGGTIRIDSQEGQGATFRFTWPKEIGKNTK